jgi:putative DNA primase/helicase
MDEKEELVHYLQIAIGYSLTGTTIEKVVFVLFGTGNNGKTTMLATIRSIISEYAALIQVNSLMVKVEDNNTQSDLADLRGARFAMTSETESGQRLAQGKLKRITQGMNSIKAVRKYENPIEFPETHKLWLDTNRKPTITDANDQATFNRLHPVPFVVTIHKDQIDRDLPQKLLAEAEGILAWAVQGSIEWHADGLPKPSAIEAANKTWRAESDQVGRFLLDRTDRGGQTLSKQLYEAYVQWSADRGETPCTQTVFIERLKDRDIRSKHSKKGTAYPVRVLEPGRVGCSTAEQSDGEVTE